MNDQETNKWKVCVRCATFNQSSYIIDAMNGFTMQQTDFPFVCCILDDCSTDGEQDVIKIFLQENFDLEDKSIVRNEETEDYVLCFAQHKTNKNCFFAVLFLKYNHYSIEKTKEPYVARWQENAKYIALCEGDDYWINPMKLQDQSGALDKNPDCTIAYSRVQFVQKDKSRINKFIPYSDHIKPGKITIKDFCREEFYSGHWCFHTSSFFYRSEFNKPTTDRDSFFVEYPYTDMPTQLWCLLHGNGYFIDNLTGCYRYMSGGYNSRVKANKDFAISQENKFICAIQKFDKITDYLYHKEITMRIKRGQFKIERLKGKSFKIIYPSYWSIISFSLIRRLITNYLKTSAPRLYNILRRIKNML